MRLASNPATRNYLFRRLQEAGRTEVFPEEYRAIEKIAESDLVSWLMHPNELSSAPAQIELVHKFLLHEDEKQGSCFLFKFRTSPPHWAAQRGWMAGVAGPYWDGDSEMTSRGTFSELTPFDQMTEEQHIEFLRQALHKKGLVIPTPSN